MPTLILPPRYTPDSIALWKAAIKIGWATERLQNWRAPEWLRESEVALYGEPLFAAAVAEALSLALLEPSFHWLTTLPTNYLKRQVNFRTLGETHKMDRPLFIKPADDKSFEARVYSSPEELPHDNVLEDSVPVLCAEPVEWEMEFRCFVLNRSVTTLSPYWRSGRLAQVDDGSWPAAPEETAEVLEFVESFLQDTAVQLPPAVVVDIGKIRHRGWAVVEANPAFGSGIYGCDPVQILPVLERACVKQEHITENDVPWVILRMEGDS
jgi:hypothetical protein